jgi:N-acetylmuramoyl-L-alanine amidase
VDGALDVRVRSPEPNQVVPRDSTFVFGSVGSGAASVTVNGAPVPVAPNGAFLAYLPTPPASAPRYTVVATRGAETAQRVVPVRVAQRRALPAAGRLVVDRGSVAPVGRLVLRGDEAVRVSVRAPRNAQVALEFAPVRGAAPAAVPDSGAAPAGARAGVRPGPRVSLVDASALRGPAPASDDAATLWATEVTAGVLAAQPARWPRLVVARGADTVRLPVGRVGALAAPSLDAGDDADPITIGRPFVQLGGAGAPADTDRVVIGRPTPEGTYRYFLLPGTVVEKTGEQGGMTRVRLDGQLEAWVDSDDARPLPAGYAPPRRVAGGARVIPAAGWVDVVLPLGDRVPYQVVERGRDVDLVLHSAVLSPDILRVEGTAADSLVRQVVYEQEATDRVRVTLRLSRDPYGYLVLYDPARSAMVLRLRRAPAVDARRPLAGLTIAVDAGHPPGGATGPTGLWEPVAVLPVAERLRTLLEERGARVLMTRTTAEPVALGLRPILARQANAHAFVSVHLNALPDGVNPFTANGTSTLFFHQHSEPLARLVQAELVRRLGLRDIGIHYQNLAVARPPWVPSILTEGLFLMLPEQEAAMRSPEGRERYARAVADGVEAYFRGLAAGR